MLAASGVARVVALARGHPGRGRRIVVCLEPRPRRTDDGIDIIGAADFARRLWQGDLAWEPSRPLSTPASRGRKRVDEPCGLGSEVAPAVAGGGGVDHRVARSQAVDDCVAVAVVEVDGQHPSGDVDHLPALRGEEPAQLRAGLDHVLIEDQWFCSEPGAISRSP